MTYIPPAAPPSRTASRSRWGKKKIKIEEEKKKNGEILLKTKKRKDEVKAYLGACRAGTDDDGAHGTLEGGVGAGSGVGAGDGDRHEGDEGESTSHFSFYLVDETCKHEYVRVVIL